MNFKAGEPSCTIPWQSNEASTRNEAIISMPVLEYLYDLNLPAIFLSVIVLCTTAERCHAVCTNEGLIAQVVCQRFFVFVNSSKHLYLRQLGVTLVSFHLRVLPYL